MNQPVQYYYCGVNPFAQLAKTENTFTYTSNGRVLYCASQALRYSYEQARLGLNFGPFETQLDPVQALEKCALDTTSEPVQALERYALDSEADYRLRIFAVTYLNDLAESQSVRRLLQRPEGYEGEQLERSFDTGGDYKLYPATAAFVSDLIIKFNTIESDERLQKLEKNSLLNPSNPEFSFMVHGITALAAVSLNNQSRQFQPYETEDVRAVTGFVQRLGRYPEITGAFREEITMMTNVLQQNAIKHGKDPTTIFMLGS